MDAVIQIGNALGPASNLITMFLALIGAVRIITTTIAKYRLSDREDTARAEKIGKRLRMNISNADTQLGWHAAMAYAQYYLDSTAQSMLSEQNKITHRLLYGGMLFGLLAWQALATLAGIVFASTTVLVFVDMHFLRRTERRYVAAERELGIAWAEQLDRMKVPCPQDDAGKTDKPGL